MSSIKISGEKKADAVHSQIISGAEAKKPVYKLALARYMALGLSEADAKALLKGQ